MRVKILPVIDYPEFILKWTRNLLSNIFCNNREVKERPFFILKSTFFLFLIFQIVNSVKAQQVTEVITDFHGFWKSGTSALNPTLPNTSHNVLSFKYHSLNYSTGVNDAKLTDSGIIYNPTNFQAFPVATVGGTIASGGSVYIALASNYDGNPLGFSNPLPSLKIRDVLIDGLHGLDLGTGATNVPASALINFQVSGITTAAISDSTPDILVSQIADPSSNGDTLYFVNSSGIVVGNKIPINWLLYNLLGTYSLDLYVLPVGALCDTAKISGTFSPFNTTRNIRLIAFKLSEFGITAGNAASVSNFILKASGTSDPAFIAYNTGAFNIPAPVITVQPASVIVCPTGSLNTTFSITATGSSLTYQWKKNNVDIPGATSSTYTISNVIPSNTGSYAVLVSNAVGSVVSNTAYLNISIAVQPFPSAQDIATGARATITVSANNATSYQWQKAGVDISGATSAAYVIDSVTSTNAKAYSVQIINSDGAGCANILSSNVTVTGKTTLYSKAAGNLNLPETWGVVSDGSGSSPVDFTRAEHTFIVKNNAATGGNLTIAGKLDVANAITTITGGTTLDSRSIIRSGSGSLAGSITSSLTVRDTSNLYFQRGSNVLKDFTVYSGKVTLLDSLSIAAGSSPGKIILNGGTLITGDSLTFKSDISGTASLVPITGDAVITGKAIVERYIPAHKAWRFLSIPANTTQTMKQAWQEGAINKDSNLVKGYGTQITGPAGTAAGFDLFSATPSMKKFDPVTIGWTGVPNTTTTINATDGYMVFIRGDRTATAFNSPVTQTIMRTYGTLYTGDQTAIQVNAGKFASIGNPYASALDMRNILKPGIKEFFYVWDPKLGGNYGLGAYQVFSKSGSNYVVTPGSGSYGLPGSVNNFIESGQAFLVEADSAGGSLAFNENSKTGGTAPTARPARSQGPQLLTSLYGVSADSSTYMIDGVFSNYDDSYSNNVDGLDAIKSANTSENLSIKTANTLLIIERRHSIVEKDTMFLNLTNVKVQQYRFRFRADQLSLPGLTGFLEDNYLHTSTPLNLNGSSLINFNIVNIAGSYAADRFRVVFRPALVLPVAFTSIKAWQENKAIAIEWKVENENNIRRYETEKSNNGIQFTSLSVTAATGNGGLTASYQITDTRPAEGYNYYRIKSIDLNGRTEYTAVVKVLIGKGNQEIIVYPNPVIDGVISIQLNNMPAGKYAVKLLDNRGIEVFDKIINHTQGSSTELITINKNMPHGVYQLEIIKPGNEMSTNKLIY